MANINNKREWFLQLIDTRKKKPVNDDSGQFQVYTAGSATRQAIYNASGTLLTQSLGQGGAGFVSRTMTDGQLSFYTNLSCSTVDISVLTLSGRAYFLKAVKASQHRVDVDPERDSFTLVTPINDVASSTTLRSTGFTARKGMIIDDVFLKVTGTFLGAATGNNMYNIGVAGDSDALVRNMNLSATGYKQILVHSSTGKIFATQFAGVQLANWDTMSIQTAGGWFSRKRYFVPTATVLSFARAVALTASFTGTKAETGKAYLFFQYKLDPTAAAIVTD